jgi:excinuclease ABC subunit C
MTDLYQVPVKPGVYMFKASGERIIYVGKAKNLRNRLRSYFRKSSGLDARKSAMVEEIKDFTFIATDNELEAWILEANLIKLHKPKFNVVLRDDKNYPYIRITVTEDWPRVDVVRRIAKDGNLYFGPYIPAQAMWEAIHFIRKNFLMRTCDHPLDKPLKPCIQYQMKRCYAPCAGKLSKTDYRKMVDEIVLFLKGEKKGLLSQLGEKMRTLSEAMEYEDAARVRDSIALLGKAFESQKIIAPELGDIDVIGFHRGEGNAAAFSILFIRNGMMIGAKDFFAEDNLGTESAELLRTFIELFYSKEIFPASSMLVPVMPAEKLSVMAWLEAVKGKRVQIVQPKAGKKYELLLMANENARLHFNARGKIFRDDTLEELAQRFKLTRTPQSIAAFDVSTISGTESVGAMVWWERGDFDKKLYRHVKIRWTEGVDDYSMIHETVIRALRNIEGRIPDLIVIDGGKGQLDVACKALRESGIKTDILSIAKKPDRAFLPEGAVFDLEDRNRSSLLLKRLRDEVHRFVIGFHRRLRDKRLTESVLEKIPGIGSKKRLDLLKQFGSLGEIRKATVEDIAQIKGFNIKTAEAVKDHLKENMTE